MITSDQVKELRDKTGISVMQCKKALEEAGGDMEKALIILKKKGAEIASKKGDRALGAGVVAAYVHSNNALGVLVELLCETDFVARNTDFKTLADDIAMHVAAMSPVYVKSSDITREEQEKTTDMFREEVEKSGKPEEIQKKMLEGKVQTFLKERTLLDQPFVKESEITVGERVERAVQKLGERIEVGRFVKFEV